MNLMGRKVRMQVHVDDWRSLLGAQRRRNVTHAERSHGCNDGNQSSHNGLLFAMIRDDDSCQIVWRELRQTDFPQPGPATLEAKKAIIVRANWTT
jgi:hypothetical protein